MKENHRISKFFCTLRSGRHCRPLGFSVIEIIFTSAIFLIFSSGAIFVILQGFDANRTGSEEAIANQYASEGIEAARSIRNQAAKLVTTAGTGVSRSTTNLWTFSGANNTFGKYTRVITVSDALRDVSGNIVASGGTVDPATKKITSTVTWKASPTRNSSVVLTTYLTNWRKPFPDAWWKFDDGSPSLTAADSSGNGNTATLNNGPIWTSGKFGQALQFDGVNDYVSVTNAFGGFPTSISVSVWIYFDEIVARHDFINAAGDTIILNTNNVNNKIGGSYDNGAGWSGTGSLPVTVVINRWYHVVYTIDNSNNQKVYLDGAEVGTNSYLAPISWEGGGTTYIGTGVNGTIDRTKGRIDDVQFYNRALSASEVQAIYNDAL